MVYRGVVKGNVVVLEGAAGLPEGTEVEVLTKVPGRRRKGSARAVLEAMREPPHLLPEDVDALEEAIKASKLNG